MAAHADVLVGIFVGGNAARMAGAPKGLLPARDTGEPLVVRLARMADELGFEAALVGKSDAYVRALPNLRVIADTPQGIGPLGGLGGLLQQAGTRPAIALACDMPFVSKALLGRLASEQPNAMVLAPKSDARWEPLCARYDAFAVRPLLTAALARGVRSFQDLYEALEPRELTLDTKQRAELVDWDRPEDISG